MLSEYLASRGELDQAGGLGYLASLVKDTPSAANVADYARIIHERGLLRRLIQKPATRLPRVPITPKAATLRRSSTKPSAKSSRSRSRGSAGGPGSRRCAMF